MPRLTVPNHILDAMIAQARAEAPNECCGLLAGSINTGIVSKHFPLINASATPNIRFESSPTSMFRAMKEMKSTGLEILAVYHSHPHSPATPSATDREWNYSLDVANVIISLSSDPPDVRCWRIDGDTFSPWELVVTN